MITNEQRERFTELVTGFRVDRAAATTPQGADDALFTITGGRILLLGLIGEVTVAIANSASASLVKHNGTATGATQDMCAALDIDNDAVGTLYTISGVVGDALRDDLLIGLNSLLGAGGMILKEGDIELECVGSIAGEIKWQIHYLPLDLGATVAAA